MATSVLPVNGPCVILRSYSYALNTSFSAREHKFITAANFGITAISGYTPLLIHSFSFTQLWKIDITWVNLNTSGNVMGLCTVDQSGQTVDGTLSLTIGWVRNDLIL